jgi:hypothetical protein
VHHPLFAQNFPEGMAVSLPLAAFGYGKIKSFLYGQLSGMVEPIAAVIGAAVVVVAVPILPYALCSAAGKERGVDWCLLDTPTVDTTTFCRCHGLRGVQRHHSRSTNAQQSTAGRVLGYCWIHCDDDS